MPGAWTWVWSPHPLGLAVVGACAIAYIVALRRLGPAHAPLGGVVTPAQVTAFTAGLVALAVAVSWPVADLARHASVTAHVVQQLLLVLAVPPLVLLGLPRWLLALATRSPRMDSAFSRATHPVLAFLIFNAAVVVAWLPAVVGAESRNPAVDAAVLGMLVAAGFMMWTPALRVVPGTAQLSTAARITYLFAQSVVFNLPALVLIFARHPLYPVLAARVASLGLSPVTDQQVAGAVAKIAGVVVLLGAVGLVLARAQHREEAGRDPDPLLWDDVERELQRLERRSKGPSEAG
ncbi:MAG: cytochrome c oxidase assembly protein [Acidimicrobiales bacterium]